MRSSLLAWALGLLSCHAFAQQPGIPPEWETRKLLDSLVSNSKKLQPLVKDLTPAAWVEKGAPDTYRAQWASVQQSIAVLQTSSEWLAKEPTRLSLALDTLFRMESLHTMLVSLAAGVRKYQNPALADLLLGVADENASNREQLRQYAIDLAATKEAELKTMDETAQRCLSQVVRQAPPSRTTSRATRPAAPAPQKTPEPKDRE